MTELRWILLAVGAVIVVLVYLWGRRAPADDASDAASRQAPELGDLELAARANVVFYIEGGRLVECGAPDDLLASGGRFSRLYGLQTTQRGNA